jgi:hypothetical protein
MDNNFGLSAISSILKGDNQISASRFDQKNGPEVDQPGAVPRIE